MYEINPSNVNDTQHAIHGGKVFDFARAQHCAVEEVIDFSANINPLGISPKAEAAIRENIQHLIHYPDRFCTALRETLAQQHRLKAGQLLIGNGSTELIHLIPRAFGFKNILIPAPTFSEYETAARLAGCGAHLLELEEKDSFQILPERLIDLIHQHKTNGIDALFLCNPNNPTGHLLPKKALLPVVAAAFHEGISVIVDEAFIDYAPSESLIGEIPWYINLIVVRNFTKFFSLPGLRIGYLAGGMQPVSQIESIKPAWSVNHLAEVAALASLADGDYIQKSLEQVEEERGYLTEMLGQIPGLTLFPSAANFILFLLNKPLPDADELAKRLGPAKILIRSCESFQGLGDRFVRIAVRSHKDNVLLVAQLRGILQPGGAA